MTCICDKCPRSEGKAYNVFEKPLYHNRLYSYEIPVAKKNVKKPRLVAKDLVVEKPGKKRRGLRAFASTKAWKLLRLKVIQMANGKCSCGEDGAHVHHMKPVKEFPDLALVESNLKLLCKACHRLAHKELPDKLFT